MTGPVTGRRRDRRPRAALAAIASALALAAPAGAATVFQQVFRDYRADQRIEVCAWAPGQLRQARGQTPPDIEQYAPSFVDQLNGALEAHARGDCEEKEEPPPPPPPPAEPERRLIDPGPTPEPPSLPRDPTLASTKLPNLEEGRAGLPLPLTVLAALAAFAALTALARAVPGRRP